MLHGQGADVEEAVGAVREAGLLGAVEAAALDGARHAFLEAHVRQGVDRCSTRKQKREEEIWLALGFYFFEA